MLTAVAAILLGLVVVFAITVATGYFVAQEFAYMAVDRSRLKARADAGDRAAERALTVTRRTSFMLSGAQLGITVTGLLVGYVAEPLIGEAIGDIVGGKLVSTVIALALGSILALLFSTFVQMLFGELYPKNYSIARADQVAAKLSRSTSIYLKVFGPVIWVFDKAAELFLRMLHIEPVHDVEHSATAIDLEHVVEESRERGELTSEQARVLDRILDFPRQNVEHAMRPRAHVDVVRDTATVGEVRELMATGHTRYPVLNDEEYILGVVHLVDVLDVTDFALPVTAIARPPLVLSALMDLPAALEQMDDQREVLACIVDEYGGDAAALWSDGADGAEVLRRLKALPGFGEQKAKIFLALLGKQYGVTPSGWRAAAGDYGKAGSHMSVADVKDAGTLQKVRSYKKEMKAKAKAAKA